MSLGLQRINEVLCYYCVTLLARNLGPIFRQAACLQLIATSIWTH